MDENKADITPFIRKATENIISVTVNGKPCTLNIFFSVNTESTYFDFYSETKDYRMSFAKIAFYLYSKTEQVTDNENLSEDDFVNATDEELIAMLLCILGDDGHIKGEYDKIQQGNIFERFYCAHKNLIDSAIAPLQEMFKAQQAIIGRTISSTVFDSIINTQKMLESISIPKWTTELAQIVNITKNLDIPRFSIDSKILQQHERLMASIPPIPPIPDISGISDALRFTAESATRIASTFDFGAIANAINSFATQSFPKFSDYPNIQSILSGIPRIAVDIPRITEPLAEQLRSISTNLHVPLEALSQALSSIDFSMLTYHKEWNAKHDTLVAFGWFYLNELPVELANEIFEKADNIKQDEVDQIIVAHFRKDKCAALKRIVRTWKSSRCFSLRKDIFGQALHCHSRGIYNASVTMLTLHTEGVITDFVRMAFSTPKRNAKEALKEISGFIDYMPFSMMTFSDWNVLFSVIEAVQIALTENFDLANPETASNNSRHKIAHGHVVEKETEANSLRRFLYLNELYRVFSIIDEELALNSVIDTELPENI